MRSNATEQIRLLLIHDSLDLSQLLSDSFNYFCKLFSTYQVIH